MMRYIITILVLLVFPSVALAQDIICPKRYQPYANRCVTQHMADYISCVEASGGNRQEIAEEVSEIGGQKASTGIKASGSGTIVKGSGSLLLGKASERNLAKKLETRWFPKGMSECARVLNKTTVRDIKKAVQEANNQTSGIITPDNKSTPNTPICQNIPSNAITLFFGNSVAYTSTFPHTVIEVGGQPLLVINKQNKNIIISAKFFSEDGKIVAELKENKFFINPNNYFRIEKPNDHILIVYDQQGNQSLNINFLNSSVIKLLGRFYLPNRPPIIINEDWQIYGGLQMSGNCFGENRVDIGLQ